MEEEESPVQQLERPTENRPKIRKTLPELYRSVDINGIIIDCNEDYAKRLDYTVDETIGMSIFDHSPPDDQKKMRDLFENWKKTGHLYNRKIRLFTKNRETVDVL